MRTMRPRHPLPLLLLAAIACQKASAPPAPGVPEPADLIAVVSVASPKAALGRVRAYAEAVSPGAGGALNDELIPSALASMVGAPALDGLDLDKPAHLLVLDPRKHPQPFALLATVADAAKVKAAQTVKVTIDGARAVVGPAEVVDAVAAYALGVVAGRPAPEAATATCSPAKLLGLYRADLEAARHNMAATVSQASPATGKLLEAEIDLLMKLADQTDVLRLSLDAGAQDASLVLALAPRAGSTFASWQGAQKPMGDLTLLDKLPTVERPTMVMAGNLQFGPLRDLVLDLMGPMLEQLIGKKVDRAAWSAFIDGFDGNLAAVGWNGAGGAMSFSELAGYADGAAAATRARDLFGMTPGPPRTGELMGIKWSYQATAEASHDGVPILGYEMAPDYDSLPAAQREMLRTIYAGALKIRFAGFDKLVAVSMGPGGAEQLGAVIDAARKGGGGTIAPAARAALEAARGRRASVVMFMDYVRVLAAMLPSAPPSASGMTFEMGVGDGATHLRIGVPAAHVRELMAAFMGR
jgi:hypothetical protein